MTDNTVQDDRRPSRAYPADAEATAGAAFDAYQQRTRFGNLDGLRFFCIAVVLWHHAPVFNSMADPALILKRGFLGVDFFFVLSGFLITTLLLREETRVGQFSLYGFYWRRLLRIVPVYFFVVTVVSVYYVLVKGETQYAELVPYYYLFLANFLTTDIPLLAPTWSLSVEEQYYMIWPLLLLLLPRRAILPVLGILIFANVAGIMGLFDAIGVRAVEAGPLRIALPNATYAPILMGSVVAIVMHDRRGFSALLRLFGHQLAPVVAFAGLLVVVQLAPADLRGLPNLAIHLLMSVCLISIVVRERTVLSPVLTLRPVARVGEISYGIYLYHLLALHVATVILTRLSWASPWMIFVVYSALSILIAEISYRTLERFFRQFKHGWRRPGAQGKAL